MLPTLGTGKTASERLKPTLYYVFYQRGHCNIFCGAFDSYDLADNQIESFVRRNEHPRIWLSENDFYIEAHALNYWILDDLQDGNT